MPNFIEPEDPFDTFSADLVEIVEKGTTPSASFSEDGFRAMRTVRCLWSNRRAVVEAFLGGAKNVGGVAQIQRPWGFQPNSTDWPFAIAVDAEIVPQTGPTSATVVAGGVAGAPDYAIIRIYFEYRDYDHGQGPDESDLFISERIESAAEFLTLPTAGLSWDAAGSQPLNKADEAPGKIVRGGVWQIKHHWLTEIPSTIHTWQGKSNADDRYSPRYRRTFAAETLHVAEPIPERVMTPTGREAWNLTLQLAINNSGWNKFHRAGMVDPQTIYEGGSPFKPYEPISYGVLVPTPP
jgi:hypothetical protein